MRDKPGDVATSVAATTGPEHGIRGFSRSDAQRGSAIIDFPSTAEVWTLICGPWDSARVPSLSLADYVSFGADKVPGWFQPLDRALFVTLGDLTADGDLLEIGAYLGKSSILLGYLARSAERVMVVDLFERPGMGPAAKEYERFYQGVTRERFERNYRRFHDRLPEVMVGYSQDVLPSIPDRSCRLVHIDGSTHSTPSSATSWRLPDRHVERTHRHGRRAQPSHAGSDCRSVASRARWPADPLRPVGGEAVSDASREPAPRTRSGGGMPSERP